MPREPKIVSKKHLARIERERRQRRYILLSSLVVLVLVFGLVGYGILEQSVLQPLQPVAKVNGASISTKDFQATVKYSRQSIISQYIQTYQFAQYFGSDPNSQNYFSSSLQQIAAQLSPADLGKQVLDNMVDDELIKQEAKRRNISVSDEELNKTLQDDFGFFPNGTPTPTATQPPIVFSTLSPQQLALVTATPTVTPTVPVTITPTIAPTKPVTSTPTSAPTLTPTPYTEQMYKDNYKKTVDNIKTNINVTESQFREIIRTQLLRKKVEDAITADLTHEQEQVWSRSILVADETTAKTVVDRVTKGEDFGKVAKEVSIDTATKDQGGDHGWQSRESMDPDYATAAFLLKIGQISGPVKTAAGWEVIQVIGHENRKLDDQQFQQAKDLQFQDWLKKQRDSSQIKIYDYYQNRIPTEPTIPAQYQQSPTGG